MTRSTTSKKRPCGLKPAARSGPLPHGRGPDYSTAQEQWHTGSEETATTNGEVRWLTVVGARQNNLRNIDVEIPLGRFVCVTGVSGSGKSSLVNDIIRETLARDLNGASKVEPGDHDRIEGKEHLDKVIDIDQSPIGRTPRSNPATYIKVFDEIRSLYCKLPDSKVRGYKPGRFSFNVHTGQAGGGRCEACEGNGSNCMEMDFLADVWVTCPVCAGKRFNRETMQILYKGRSIADVLNMDVQEALTHFENVPKIRSMLATLHDVGLDYIKLGQSSTTLSGGEAQRIKLARELVKKSTGQTLYLLDEPTTGLHFADIKKLLDVLHGFVDAGNTVMVIEHNLDVIKTADWVIDLGPEGGVDGGRVVALGTPEQVAKSKRSYTGVALRDVLRDTDLLTSSKHSESAQAPLKASLAIACGSGEPLPIPARRDGSALPRRFAPGSDRDRENGTEEQVRRRDVITVIGAKQHNLKDITVEVPRGKMTVCCGPSGSGKSSFAVDTVYTEGQRRYVESLSSYARQFVGQLQPPRVDHIYGLSPSICIERRSTSKSPRSTVGTVTEIYDYMRILWARLGQPYCPYCRVPIGTQSSDEIVDKLMGLGEGQRVWLLAPISPTGGESYGHLFERELRNGYARVRVDGQLHSLSDDIDSKRRHAVELVVDRIILRRKQVSRITDSVEQALSVGNGVLIALMEEMNKAQDEPQALACAASKMVTTTRTSSNISSSETRFSQHRSCDRCGRSFEELTPHHFSFNNRLGWCESCEGLGVQQGASPAAIVLHPTRSIADGAIGGWGVLDKCSKLFSLADALARHIGFDIDRPWNQLTESQRLTFLQGCGDDWIDAVEGLRFRWRGFFPAIDRATRSSWQYRKQLEDLVTEVPCESCNGGRLRRESAAVRLGNATLHEVCTWSMRQALKWFKHLDLDTRQRKIAGELLHEIRSRLGFLVDVGLDYVTLHRTSSTLSGGESQRIQLTSQIGTGLTGVLYVLDEPTIGLHPRDNHRLIGALHRLRDLGNTLLLVEHDREVIDASDQIMDFGPAAGDYGGTITAAGTPKRLRSKRASLTGKYLSQKEAIAVPSNRRLVPPSWKIRPHLDQSELEFDGRDEHDKNDKHDRKRGASDIRTLIVHGARENNLKEIDVAFPLGRFTCVTGVSGSGKSTLVSSILHAALAVRIHRVRLVPGGHERISGIEHIDKVINVDQSPIGNSPTSTAATYTGLFDAIRELFAKLPVSKMRGYSAYRFSFNRSGGRCESCEGMGQRCIEMHFLPDVWIECESCNGTRYIPETLDVRYRGKSIADVLHMSVSEALKLFANVPRVRKMLQTLDDVGLGYLPLGQPAPTLSAGEAQRVKLATELGRPSTGKTLYILDEPTTGLHFDDIKKLLTVLHRLVDLGNTCICIEHNLDVIKTADWVIDLGPEAGDGGGEIVVEGTPEEIAKHTESHTGQALAPVLAASPTELRKAYDPRQETASISITAPAPFSGENHEAADDVDVAMPWERNGKKWHTVDHLDTEGKPVLWDSEMLLWLVETMESLGLFRPTDWNHSTRIEITASKGKEWFCHILTGNGDLLDVSIRVDKDAFTASGLQKLLNIKTLDQRGDLPIYGQWQRMHAGPIHDNWQQVRLSLRDFVDVNKTKFRRFLKSAIKSYEKRLNINAQSLDGGDPWKSDGMQWHLSQQSIHKRHAIRWKPDLLMALIGKFKALDPKLQVRWDTRTAVRFFYTTETSDYVAKIVTNMGRGLRVEMRVPPSTITPVMIDRLGEESRVKQRPNYDWIDFWVKSLTQLDGKQLRDVWQRSRDKTPEDRGKSPKGRLRSA